jgi:general secretion pathway protein H
MQTSAIGERGFTLVEMMAVLAILALSTAAVLLVVPTGRGSALKSAEKLAARIVLVRDEAVIAARPMAVAVDAGGYRFEEWRGGEWLAASGKIMAPIALDKGLSASPAGRVSFDATGAADRGMTITIMQNDERASVQINANGQVKIAR